MSVRTKTATRAIVVAVLVVLAFALFLPKKRQGTPTRAAAGNASPAQATAETKSPSGMTWIDGASLLARVKRTPSRAVLVNVWASWCGSCKAEIPALLRLAPTLAESKVELWFVSVDEPADEEKASGMMREFGGKEPGFLVQGSLEAFKAVMNPRWPGMLPATFLFDANGQLRHFWGGPAFEKDLLPVVNRFLAGENVDGETTFGLAPGRVDNG